jgi:F-type H+-transporting ATPase subunit b
MFEINPGLIVWTIITFLILLVVLRAVAWKPLVRALTTREEKIRTALLQAEEAQRRAEQLLAENKRQMAEAEGQAQHIIKEGRLMGERIKTEIVDRANQASRQMIAQATEEINREKESALKELRTEMADLVITATGKILDANLDTPKQRALVDTVIKQIAKG